MSRLLKQLDKINVQILGDDLTIDGIAVKGYFYKSVIAPEYGTQSTELVEFYCDVFKHDLLGLACLIVGNDGALFDVVRHGEADDLTMLRLHISPVQIKKPHKTAGI